MTTPRIEPVAEMDRAAVWSMALCIRGNDRYQSNKWGEQLWLGQYSNDGHEITDDKINDGDDDNDDDCDDDNAADDDVCLVMSGSYLMFVSIS